MQSIEVKNLSFSYHQFSGGDKGKEILSDINLSMAANETVGIIGANGVGKSTLLKLLVGLQLSYSGSVAVNEIPVRKDTLSKVREKIGYVFQDSDSQLFMSTVYEDVAFAPRNYKLSVDEIERRVTMALQAVHIEHLRDKQIYRLSGGQKKLVSIATILSMQPDIIMMDEPSVALDPKNRRNLINVLNSLGGLKIIASHDLDFIFDTCKRTILMADGKLIKDGKTEELLLNRELLEANGLELPLSCSRR